MRSDRLLRAIEFALWVLAASAAVVPIGLFLGLLLGRSLVAGKYALFVVGVLLFGLGSLMIQPSPPRPPENASAGPGSGHREGDDGAAGLAPAMLSASREGRSGLWRRVREPAESPHRYESRLQTIGPLADGELPFERRVGRGYKVLATSLVVLAVSFAMEIVGVQV